MSKPCPHSECVFHNTRRHRGWVSPGLRLKGFLGLMGCVGFHRALRQPRAGSAASRVGIAAGRCPRDGSALEAKGSSQRSGGEKTATSAWPN